MPVIDLQQSLELGISGDLKEYYRERSGAYEEKQKKYARVLKTDKRQIKEVFKESIPFPSLWPYGQPRKHRMFKDRLVTFEHRNFELTIDSLKWDVDDETIKGDTETHLGGVTNRFLQIFDVLMADALQGTNTLGVVIPDAFDGVGLASETDGDGNDRFGVSGGNKITVSGFGSEADIIDAIHDGEARWRQYLDTEGQPFWAPDEVDFGKMTLIVSPMLAKPAYRARDAFMTRVDKTMNFPSENILQHTFDVWVNPRITVSNKAWLVLENEYYKPFGLIDRKVGPSVYYGRMGDNNSDRANETGIETLYADNRMGIGIISPHSIIEFSL